MHRVLVVAVSLMRIWRRPMTVMATLHLLIVLLGEGSSLGGLHLSKLVWIYSASGHLRVRCPGHLICSKHHSCHLTCCVWLLSSSGLHLLLALHLMKLGQVLVSHLVSAMLRRGMASLLVLVMDVGSHCLLHRLILVHRGGARVHHGLVLRLVGT